MSDYETQARIVHQSNVIRDAIKGLSEWEKDMKNRASTTQLNECAFSEVNIKKQKHFDIDFS